MGTDGEPEAAPTPVAPAGHSVITPPDPAEPRRLSTEFALILREFEVEAVTLREVIVLLHGRGYVLLVMLLALPFCTPIPLPGLSTPFGLIIALIGARLVVGAKPWLPACLLDTRLPPAIFVKVFAVTRKVLVGFERMLRPRLRWMTGSSFLLQCHAVPIVICALLLLLPLPVPFSNTLPAWGIMLIAAGLLERDGGFIIAGYVTTVAAVAFFAVLGFAGEEAIQAAWKWLAGWFAR